MIHLPEVTFGWVQDDFIQLQQNAEDELLKLWQSVSTGYISLVQLLETWEIF